MDESRKKQLMKIFFILSFEFRLVEVERLINYLELIYSDWNELEEGAQFCALAFYWYQWYGKRDQRDSMELKYQKLFSDKSEDL